MSQWSRGEDPAYLYYCDNETVVGVEFPDVPDAKGEEGLADVTPGLRCGTCELKRIKLL